MDFQEERPTRRSFPRLTSKLATQLVFVFALAAVLIYILTDRPDHGGIPKGPAETGSEAQASAPESPAGAIERPKAGKPTRPAASARVLPGPSIFPDSSLLETRKEKNFRFQPAPTPSEAYATMVKALLTDGDARDIAFFRKQKSRAFEVLQNERRAVVYFGEKPSGEYRPFLFARTREGWVFDHVNQCRLVISGSGNLWKVAYGDHDYLELFRQRRFPQTPFFDIPWTNEDIYYPENDSRIVQRILELEGSLDQSPDDFQGCLEVARLGIMVNRPPSAIIPWLDKAKALRPDDPRPYLYAAGALVGRVYEPRRAIGQLEEALGKDPRNLFGRKLLAYLHFMIKDYNAAVGEFQAVLRDVPGDCYASTYLGLSLAGRLKLKKSPEDSQAAAAALGVSFLAGCGPMSQRAAVLWGELKRQGLIERARLGFSDWRLNYRDHQGVLIYDVQPGRAAEKSGLEPGDYLLTFDGRPVRNPFEVQYLCALAEPGREVKLGIIRGALTEPLTLADGIEVIPRTKGLDPPREMTLTVIPERRPAKD